ncbi:MAG: hypothetical protein AAGJ38_08320 [Planctomycetota bacterium]
MKFCIASIVLLTGVVCVSPATSAATVAEFEFDREGRTEGWRDRGKGTGVDDLTSDGQYLVGTSPGVDPQLICRRDIRRASYAQWESVIFRIRETETPDGEPIEFNPTGVLVEINGGGRGGLRVVKRGEFTIEESGDGFYTVTVNIAAFEGDTINDLRLDPIGGTASNSNSDTAGNTFEIDFIHVTDSSSAVAEEPD